MPRRILPPESARAPYQVQPRIIQRQQYASQLVQQIAPAVPAFDPRIRPPDLIPPQNPIPSRYPYHLISRAQQNPDPFMQPNNILNTPQAPPVAHMIPSTSGSSRHQVAPYRQLQQQSAERTNSDLYNPRQETRRVENQISSRDPRSSKHNNQAHGNEPARSYREHRQQQNRKPPNRNSSSNSYEGASKKQKVSSSTTREATSPAEQRHQSIRQAPLPPSISADFDSTVTSQQPERVQNNVNGVAAAALRDELDTRTEAVSTVTSADSEPARATTPPTDLIPQADNFPPQVAPVIDQIPAELIKQEASYHSIFSQANSENGDVDIQIKEERNDETDSNPDLDGDTDDEDLLNKTKEMVETNVPSTSTNGSDPVEIKKEVNPDDELEEDLAEKKQRTIRCRNINELVRNFNYSAQSPEPSLNSPSYSQPQSPMIESPVSQLADDENWEIPPTEEDEEWEMVNATPASPPNNDL